MERAAFDSAVRVALMNTLRSLGEDSLTSVLTSLGRGNNTTEDSLDSRLMEVDTVLDELFTKFSRIIKHVVVLEACTQLKLEPPKLGNSLFWMVEELRSSMWKART